jgi:hypothetical protein
MVSATGDQIRPDEGSCVDLDRELQRLDQTAMWAMLQKLADRHQAGGD